MKEKPMTVKPDLTPAQIAAGWRAIERASVEWYSARFRGRFWLTTSREGRYCDPKMGSLYIGFRRHDDIIRPIDPETMDYDLKGWQPLVITWEHGVKGIVDAIMAYGTETWSWTRNGEKRWFAMREQDGAFLSIPAVPDWSGDKTQKGEE